MPLYEMRSKPVLPVVCNVQIVGAPFRGEFLSFSVTVPELQFAAGHGS